MNQKSIRFMLIILIALVLISGCGKSKGAQEITEKEAETSIIPTTQAEESLPGPTPLPESPPEGIDGVRAVEPVIPSGSVEQRIAVIEITPEGFIPASITIKAGESIFFVNKDSKEHRPASAVHPTHAVYPDSGGCIGSKFDACKGLSKDEGFPYRFNHKGTWKYHDHLNPSLKGIIIVE